MKRGDLVQAESLITLCIKQNPHHADSLHLLGLIKSQTGKLEEGLKWVEMALQKRIHPMYYNNLGLILSRLGRWKDAITQYRLALKLSPDFLEARLNLATALSTIGKVAQSIPHFKNVIDKDPFHLRAFFNWGNALHKLGRHSEALEKFDNCVQIQPTYADAWQNKGSMHEYLKQWEEAERAYTAWDQLTGNALKSGLQLIHLYYKQGMYSKAKPYLQKLKQKYPSDRWLELHIACLVPDIFKDSQEIDHYIHRLENTLQKLVQSPPPLTQNTLSIYQLTYPFSLAYAGLNELPLKSKFGAFFEKYFSQIRTSTTVRNKNLPSIAMLVTGKHEGVFLRCMKGFIENFNKDLFHFTIICEAPLGFEILSSQIRNSSVEFLLVPNEIEKAHQIIQKKRFDILYYWEVGSDSLNYFLPYLKPAAVQCASWGWPVTSGIPAMDYFISCKALEEQENYSSYYSEKVILLERLPTYYYRPQLPETLLPLSYFHLPENKNLYLCLQNIRKIHPDMDEVFAKILERDPQGILVILGSEKRGAIEILVDRFERILKNHKNRITVLNRLNTQEYFSIMHCASVILDTFYYTGGANTSCDAFAMGKPYVTLLWHQHRGRYGAAAYLQANVKSAPIANSFEEYIQFALRLTRDQNYYEKISGQMQKGSIEIFEDIQAVRELEYCFLSLVNRSDSKAALIKAESKTDSFEVIKLNNENSYPAYVPSGSGSQSIDIEKTPGPEKDERKNQHSITDMKNGYLKEVEQRSREVWVEDTNDIGTLSTLLNFLEIKGEYEEFEKVCDKISLIEQDSDFGWIRKALYSPPQMRNQEEEKLIFNRLKSNINDLLSKKDLKVPDLNTIIGQNWMTASNYLYLDENLLEVKKGMASIFSSAIRKMNKRIDSQGNKLKLVYVVTNDNEETFIRCFKGIIDHLSKENFEIIILCLSSIYEHIRNTCSESVSVISFTDLNEGVINLYNVNANIIHYWAIGSDAFNYFMPFFRLAAVQCTSLGLPITSGIENVDYYISNQFLETSDSAHHYNEKLYLLDHLPIYLQLPVLDSNSIKYSDFGLPEQGHIYMCNHGLRKVRPIFDSIIKEILTRDKYGYLVFMKEKNDWVNQMVIDRIHRECEQFTDRIYFTEYLSGDRYLQWLNLSTVVLDTPVYNGVTSIFDAWACEKPVVTLKGKTQRSRFTYSAYRQMGFNDGVANNLEEYIDIAIKFAYNRAFLETYLIMLKDNIHKLWNIEKVAEEYRNFYLKAFHHTSSLQS
ncbi:MAG TPA: tetratricopeptide repeat protein [Saprospiraceae bacterium]|nr:tetratricopeptide repeat protein [Saprospiraceae bacterium]